MNDPKSLYQGPAGQDVDEMGSADEAGKILVDEFRAKYPGWAQPARVAAGVATVYRELL